MGGAGISSQMSPPISKYPDEVPRVPRRIRTRDGTVKDIRLTGGVLARRFAGNQLVHPAMSHNGVWRTVGIIHPGDESFPALGRERAFFDQALAGDAHGPTPEALVRTIEVMGMIGPDMHQFQTGFPRPEVDTTAPVVIHAAGLSGSEGKIAHFLIGGGSGLGIDGGNTRFFTHDNAAGFEEF